MEKFEIIVSSEKDKNELLKQLHEQYAVNNNASMGSVASLFVSMFTAVGAYGFVWINSGIESCQKFDFADLAFTAICAHIILLIMSYICMYQGTSQRLEQFITFKIRKDFGLVNFFPRTYSPFNKKGLQVVQGLYGEFVKIFAAISFFIFVSFLTKACILGYKFEAMTIIILFAIWLLYYAFNFLFLFNSIYRYKQRLNEFSFESGIEYRPFNFWLMLLFYELYESLVEGMKKCWKL